MKKIIYFFIIALCSFYIGAEEISNSVPNVVVSSEIEAKESAPVPAIDPVTGFPEITKIPYIIFNEGFAYNYVTRIIKQEGRSNFVFEDYMVGAYFGFTTRNMQPRNSTVRLALYYPVAFSFNKVPQVAKNVIQFAVDLFAAPNFEFNMWQYVRFSFAPGLHFMFQNADRWNYINLGLGSQIGLELPLAPHWTILADFFASYDYGNLGTNQTMEPLSATWQYQFQIGVRYSSKDTNIWNYLRK